MVGTTRFHDRMHVPEHCVGGIDDYDIPRLAPCQCTAIAMYLGQCSLSTEIPTEIRRNHNALMSKNCLYTEFVGLVPYVIMYRAIGARVPRTAVHAMFLCEKHRNIGVHRGSCAMYLCFDML